MFMYIQAGDPLIKAQIQARYLEKYKMESEKTEASNVEVVFLACSLWCLTLNLKIRARSSRVAVENKVTHSFRTQCSFGRIIQHFVCSLWQSEFVLTLTVCLQYFIQHGFHLMVLNFGAKSHFTFMIACFITFYVHRALQQKTTTSMYYLLYALPIFTK